MKTIIIIPIIKSEVKEGEKKMYIRFEYKDEFTNGEWKEQECIVRGLQECKEIYGLGIDCEYRILEIREEK